MPTLFDQSEYAVRCEWGPRGVAELAPASDVVVVIDVLSFTTCVEVAVSRGATVYPYRWRDEGARDFAQRLNAQLAGRRGGSPISLSPVSLLALPAGARIVLPSPNGSTLSLTTGSTPTLAGCLRNATAVARQATRVGERVALIPAGERWKDDDSLRPALEDWLAAGAIAAALPGLRSPETEAAVAVFEAARHALEERLLACGSGRELVAGGHARDVALSARLDDSTCVPILRDGAYVALP